MKKPISPCYKCEDRSERCHVTCEKYIAYANDTEIARNERREYGQLITITRTKLSRTELRRRSKK